MTKKQNNIQGLIISIVVIIITVIIYNQMSESTISTPTEAFWVDKKLKLTQHAKERMLCRHIDSFEIREVISKGNINYAKSDTLQTVCRQKFALEGVSRDKQHLRIIVAPCNEELIIITVIDTQNSYGCD